MRIRFAGADTAAATFYDDLVPFLVSLGNQVEVVISKAGYRRGRDLESAISHLAGETRILRTMDFGVEPVGTGKKALVLLLYIVHMAIYTLFGQRTDINIVLTTPPFMPLWGFLLSKVRRQPYFVLLHDLYPQLMFEYRMISGETLLAKMLIWLSKLSLHHAQGIIVIGRCVAANVQEIGVPPERIHIIPNWIDERLVYPVDNHENQFRKNLGLADKFVVLYSGNMGLAHYFDDILAVAEQMQNLYGIVFVFIGFGARYNEIKARVENLSLTNVVLLPLQDIGTLGQSLSAGDLHLVTLRDACTGMMVPSKAFGALAVGRPIIYQGSARGELAQMIREQDIGTVVACGDVEGLKQTILKYFNRPHLCEAQGRKARALVVNGPYSRTRALERFAEVLRIETEEERVRQRLPFI